MTIEDLQKQKDELLEALKQLYEASRRGTKDEHSQALARASALIQKHT